MISVVPNYNICQICVLQYMGKTARYLCVLSVEDLHKISASSKTDKFIQLSSTGNTGGNINCQHKLLLYKKKQFISVISY